MIRILTILFFVCICAHDAWPQKNNNDLRKKILTIADSLKTKYQHYPLYAKIESDSIGFSIYENKMFTISIKNPKNIEFAKNLYVVLDELAQSDNYFDKMMTHTIYTRMIGRLRHIEDSLINIKIDHSKINNLIQDIVYSDLINCLRYCEDDFAISYLNTSHLNSNILGLLKTLLEHPERTEKEADLVVRSYAPHYSLKDTIGFAEMKRKYKVMRKEFKRDTAFFLLASKIDQINDWMRWAIEDKLTLEQWFNERNKGYFKSYRDSFLKRPVAFHSTINFVGNNYVTELASPLEKLYLIWQKEYRGKAAPQYESIDLVLARLNFKNYQEQVLTSIAKDVSSNNAEKNYRRLLDNALYINSQNAYSTIAPLLLVKDSIAYINDYYTVGAYTYNQLERYITNIPHRDEIIAEATKVEQGSVDELKVIGETEGFLEGIYKWMIANKGNYQIVSD